MRDKESKSSSLERKRFIFLEIGAIIALAAVLVAFNYRSYRSNTFLDFDRNPDKTIEELPEITVHPDKPIPQAPPPPTTLFNVLDDEIKVEDDYKIDVEANQNTEVGDYVPFVPDEETVPEPELPFSLDRKPKFPGGDAARIQFLKDELKFPGSAVDIGLDGTVYIRFIVEPNGSITNIEVARGPGSGLNQEALRVAHLMPAWEPGIKNGKPVRVLFTMPIKFVLQ